jgi:hypothetical protein
MNGPLAQARHKAAQQQQASHFQLAQEIDLTTEEEGLRKLPSATDARPKVNVEQRSRLPQRPSEHKRPLDLSHAVPRSTGQQEQQPLSQVCEQQSADARDFWADPDAQIQADANGHQFRPEELDHFDTGKVHARTNVDDDEHATPRGLRNEDRGTSEQAEFPPPPDIDEDQLPPPIDSQPPASNDDGDDERHDPGMDDDKDEANDRDEHACKQSSLGYLTSFVECTGAAASVESLRLRRLVKGLQTSKLRFVQLTDEENSQKPLERFFASLNVRDTFGAMSGVNVSHKELSMLYGTGSPANLMAAFRQGCQVVRVQCGVVSRFLRRFKGDAIICADRQSKALWVTKLIPDDDSNNQRPDTTDVEHVLHYS